MKLGRYQVHSHGNSWLIFGPDIFWCHPHSSSFTTTMQNIPNFCPFENGKVVRFLTVVMIYTDFFHRIIAYHQRYWYAKGQLDSSILSLVIELFRNIPNFCQVLYIPKILNYRCAGIICINLLNKKSHRSSIYRTQMPDGAWYAISCPRIPFGFFFSKIDSSLRHRANLKIFLRILLPWVGCKLFIKKLALHRYCVIEN